MALTPGTRLRGYDLEMNLSYVHGVGTTPLLADTIGGALNLAAERWGKCDALSRAISSSATRTASCATKPIARPVR